MDAKKILRDKINRGFERKMLSKTDGGFVSVQRVFKDADDQIDTLLKHNEELETKLESSRRYAQQVTDQLDEIEKFRDRLMTYGHTNEMVAKAYEVILNELQAILKEKS